MKCKQSRPEYELRMIGVMLMAKVNIYIYIYMRGAFNKFPDFFLYRHLKLS